MTIAENLNKIWSEFRKVGITDDLVIIEYLARLLLEEVLKISISTMFTNPMIPPKNYMVMGFFTDLEPYMSYPLNKLEQPIDTATNLVSFDTFLNHPKGISNLNLESIQENLKNAINQVDNIPKLFNHHILFRLSTQISGGRYPTPRHITKFIYNLAQIEPDHSLADFACGSGGFLVERELTIDNYKKTLGIDISPEWIKLAYSNIALRRFPPQLRTGNALDIATSNKLTFKNTEYTTFDRILMNPPFGEKIDSKIAQQIFNKTVGTRSETVLTNLAIQKLADNGIAGIMVPSGLLFSNSKGEKELRQTLIDDYHLKAVITLPKDALQPYSSLQSHVLLINHLNDSDIKDKMTWFFQLEEDGYSAGKSRDLTKKPDLSKSDFPFVEGMVKKFEYPFDYLSPLNVADTKDEINLSSQIGIQYITNDKNKLLGFIIQGIATTQINSVIFYPSPLPSISAFLLIDTLPIDNEKLCIQLSLDGNKANIIENPLQYLNDLFKPTKNNSIPESRLYSQPVQGIAIAFSTNTIITKDSFRILGVGIRQKDIIKQDYDLRPEEYIDKPTETPLTNSPVELLTRIYSNQRQLTQNLETLFSRIELPPIATQKLPSPIEETFTPIGQLNPQQQVIWDKIQAKTQPYSNDDGDNYKIALHFTPQDIESEDNGEISDITQRTLELLEGMGVIIPVTIHNKLYYRRVTERDLWTNLD